VIEIRTTAYQPPPAILLTLPLAAVGAFGALSVFDMPLGIFAFIGLIMLATMLLTLVVMPVVYTLFPRTG